MTPRTFLSYILEIISILPSTCYGTLLALFISAGSIILDASYEVTRVVLSSCSHMTRHRSFPRARPVSNERVIGDSTAWTVHHARFMGFSLLATYIIQRMHILS